MSREIERSWLMKSQGWLAVLVLACAACGGNSARAQTGYSLASLKGSFAGEFVGKILTPDGLLTFLGTGIFVADGKGNISGHETYTVVTTPCSATLEGTYTVDPDGSGTAAIAFNATGPGCSSGTYTQSLAIGQGGKLVLLSNTNGDQIQEAWHLQ